MCLGAAARTANANARRRYKYEIERRERNWNQTTSMYNAQLVKYQEDSENVNLAMAQAVVDQQEAMDNARGQAQVKYQELFRKVFQNSDYSKLVASGQTGKSTRRMGALEFAKYGRDVSEISRQLVLNDRELAKKTGKQQAQYKQFKDQAFAKVAFQPIPDVAPPVPVMQNVGAAALMDGLSIASSVSTMGGSSGFNWWN